MSFDPEKNLMTYSIAKSCAILVNSAGELWKQLNTHILQMEK